MTASGDPSSLRQQAVTDLVAGTTSERLFARLREALGTFGIRDIAVFAMSGDEPSLAFSCGTTHLETPGTQLQSLSWLADFLTTDSDWIEVQPEEGALPVVAAFRMAVREKLMGFILFFAPESGRIERHQVAEIMGVARVFSATFHKIRVADSMHRAYMRASSTLREFREGQEILLLDSLEAIYAAILARTANNLGSDSGLICIKEENGWREVHRLGTPSLEGIEALEHMRERAFAENRPGLVGSLSGEEQWVFDADTIHMASAVVFPLTSRDTTFGCLAVFDATFSQDAVETVGGTMLVGATAIESWMARQRLLDQRRIEEQLALAAKTQQRLLPSTGIDIRGVSVAHFSQYCDETGGDYVDTIPGYSPSVCSVVIGDVSGHGLGAAMHMVDVRARLSTLLQGWSCWSPHEALTTVNRVLCRESAPEEFVTLFVATLDSSTGVVRYANAGHEPPLLFRARTGMWQELSSTGLPLGLFEHATFGMESVILESGDVLVLLTDGLTEAQDMAGNLFGTQTLREVVRQHANEPAHKILEEMVDATRRFCADEEFVDDLTCLLANIEEVRLRHVADPPPIEGEEIYSSSFAGTDQAKDEALQAMQSVLAKDLEERDLRDLALVAEEAMQNAILHGHQGDTSKRVQVALHRSSTEVTVVVCDEGQGFDSNVVLPRHFTREAVREASGRGVLIMAALMDEVVYWDGGRRVAMRKKLTPPTGAPPAQPQ